MWQISLCVVLQRTNAREMCQDSWQTRAMPFSLGNLFFGDVTNDLKAAKAPNDSPHRQATSGRSRLSVCLALAYQERDDKRQTPEWCWRFHIRQEERQEFVLEYLHCQFFRFQFLLLRQALAEACLFAILKKQEM